MQTPLASKSDDDVQQEFALIVLEMRRRFGADFTREALFELADHMPAESPVKPGIGGHC